MLYIQAIPLLLTLLLEPFIMEIIGKKNLLI